MYNCFITESDKCYFYLLNPSTIYCYRGDGILWNENLNKFSESQNQITKSEYITIKALESPIECAISGLNGAFYKVHEMQDVIFARKEGEYILKFLNSEKQVRKFKVCSGRGYFIINSEKCIDMESNSVLPLFEGEDDIEIEANNHETLLKKRELMLKSQS